VYVCVCVCVCVRVRAAIDRLENARGAVWCNVLQCVAVYCGVLLCDAVCCSVLQHVAACCSVLQCVAVCCSGLQRKKGSNKSQDSFAEVAQHCVASTNSWHLSHSNESCNALK